ncbi:hypothetical protein QWA_14037 [Alcaligenes faecalis subsp. faecalis NCIB 8687]|nr:hypothetical protein QWA_14037 [Alcaligenes faecalis subsp. faecalis NCIB 8687]
MLGGEFAANSGQGIRRASRRPGMQPERLNRAGQRGIRMVSVLLHGRMRQNGAELLQRMLSGFDSVVHRLGRIRFVLSE